MTLDEAKEIIRGYVSNIIGEWYSKTNDNGMGAELEQVLAAIDPPITDETVDRALAAWFANTQHGWKAAMRAALEASR